MNTLPATPPAKPFRLAWLNRAEWLFVAVVFALLAVRTWLFIDRYSVNILFWDQWDFYKPFFDRAGIVSIFDHQHGPHRQGLGFLLTRVLAGLSDWDSRWDAFGVGAVLIVSAALGLRLAYRCGLRGAGLVVVPLLFLNIRQYEMFVNASNISHGAMPVLLCVTLMLCWFIKNDGLRLAAISVLTFCCIFTGFSIFMGLVVPALLLVEGFQHWKRAEKRTALLCLAALAFVATAWFLFSVNYHFEPAVDGYRFPYEKPHEYLLFMAGMLANFHGFKAENAFHVGIGLVLVALLVWICASHARKIWQGPLSHELRSVVIFSLAAFALLYCANTAIGRVFYCWQISSAASRYVTLVIPAGLALYLHFGSSQNRIRGLVFSAGYAVLLAYNTVELHTGDWRNIRHYSEGKRAWKAAYLATHDETKANQLSDFQVYPIPALAERLKYLEDHHLNLFKPDNR